MDRLSPRRPRISIGSESPATPPSTPVASPSPKPDSGIRQSGQLLKQLSAVVGEGASSRHRFILHLYGHDISFSLNPPFHYN